MALLHQFQRINLLLQTIVDAGFASRRCAVSRGLNYKAIQIFLSVFVLFVSAGCSNTVNEMSDNTVNNNAIVGNPSSTEPVDIGDNADVSQPPESQTSSSQLPTPQVDQSGVPGSDSDLAQLLLTDYVVENNQFVPVTGWICTDTIDQQRIYYFYPQGLLDANRSVAIERTLNPNDTLSDLTFFWSATASDAIMMTRVTRDGNGAFLSTGQQYDFNSIRFQEVDSVQTFVAETVLRGRLVCGNFSLR